MDFVSKIHVIVYSLDYLFTYLLSDKTARKKNMNTCIVQFFTFTVMNIYFIALVKQL